MKNEPGLSIEEQTFNAYSEWISRGRHVRGMFDRMGFPIPKPLSLALGGGNDSGKPRKLSVTAPERPESPPQAKNNWQWIPVAKASVRTVFLSILNEGNPMKLTDIARRVKEMLPNSNTGSVYNIPAQISEKVEKGPAGWTLRPGQTAPIMFKGHIWAPKEAFQALDLAEIRRFAIEYLLTINSDGLQIMQIFKQLEGAEWLDTPKSKDLVKTDLLIMKKQGVVKRVGNSNKWTLSEREK